MLINTNSWISSEEIAAKYCIKKCICLFKKIDSFKVQYLNLFGLHTHSEKINRIFIANSLLDWLNKDFWIDMKHSMDRIQKHSIKTDKQILTNELGQYQSVITRPFIQH